MPIWSDAYLNSLLADCEKEISRQLPCVATRFSLSATSGVAEYSLPSYVTGIINITWKGHTVWPEDSCNFKNFLEFKPTLIATSPTGRPLYYFRDGYGYDKIKFFPIPDETIAADDTSLSLNTSIDDLVIVTALREADPDDADYQIPSFNRRVLTRYGAMARAFRKEGQGQNIEASDYFKRKYEVSKGILQRYLQNLDAAMLKAMLPQVQTVDKVARPVLPSNFGTEVGD